jgi:hypothetical protein
MKDKTKTKNIPHAVKHFNGVTHAKIASDEYPENISILKACKAARKTSVISKSDVLDALK